MYEPKTKTIKLPPKGYMPHQKDLEAEHDMPGLCVDDAREVFFTPVKFEKDE